MEPALTPYKEAKEIKEYELKLNNDIYRLTLEHTFDEIIFMTIRQINNLSFYIYKNNFNYEEITKNLSLLKEHYNDIIKSDKFY